MSSAVIAILVMGAVALMFLFDVLPAATTAMLGCVAMVVFGACGLPDVLSGLTNDIVLTVFGMGIIGSVMLSSGFVEKISDFLVARVKGSEKVLVCCVTLISALLSTVMNNTIVCILMLTVCSGIVKKYPHYRMTTLAINVALGAIFGGVSTLIGAAPQIYVSGVMAEQYGTPFGMFSITGIGVAATVICLLYVMFVGLPLGKKIFPAGDNGAAVAAGRLPDSTPFSRKKFVISIFVLALVIFLSVSEICSVGCSVLIGALVCLVSGAVKQKEALANVDWSTVIWFACCMGLAKALSVSGANTLIANTLMSFIGSDVNPYFLLAFVILVTMVLSNFIANVTTAVIMLPIVMPLVDQFGYNPMAFAVGIVFGATIAIATPLANGFLGMTQSYGYKFKDYVLYGLPLMAVEYIAAVALIPLAFPL